MEHTPDTVTELLAALGECSNDVADRLRELGHKGIREEACSCPVAQYLAANGVPDPEVDGQVVMWGGYDGRGRTPCVDAPRGVINFVQRFDKNEFPDLVAEVSE